MDLSVVVSIGSKTRVYHRPGCPYEKRIYDKYRMRLSVKRAHKKGYHACRFCGSMRGFFRVYGKEFTNMADGLGAELRYDLNTFFVRTDEGFWKFFWFDDACGFVLYHRNSFCRDWSFESMMRGNYHRQKDVKATVDPRVLIQYIAAHDRAKKTIADDYRKLPRSTKKEKQYYQAAKNRDRRKQVRRVERLFELLASGANNRELLAIR